MDNLILSSATIGIVISLLAYEIGLAAQRKWKLAILNPLLISIALVIVFLVVFHVDYDSYQLLNIGTITKNIMRYRNTMYRRPCTT